MSAENKFRPGLDKDDLDALEHLRRHTDAARVRIHQEIAAYPAPIPACDAQFNYLLEQRSNISQQLLLLDGLLEQYQRETVDSHTVREIVANLRQIEVNLAKKIASVLSKDRYKLFGGKYERSG